MKMIILLFALIPMSSSITSFSIGDHAPDVQSKFYDECYDKCLKSGLAKKKFYNCVNNCISGKNAEERTATRKP
ncbi:hypothetical protein PRIPAC_83434 [Pristionchus pacificus]|uniref:Uncharacterized protein n=1 Tax=Pristionchus pacificus TaxID=54126 RepID=A0A454Y6A5_PRIPA|nr:hypothetical protein PRIPAC_83434 [Pristionchus pacificus]|eukprot:PDM68755.1 hypothetical protein PRIPAC_47057 [Pristionchus pacificus]